MEKTESSSWGSSKFVNQEIQIYYLVIVDHNGIAVHLTRSPVKGFKKCCISSAVDETDNSKLWNGSEED